MEQLINEHGAQFNVPPTIGGTMTKVANPYFSRPMQAASRVPHMIDGAPHEVVRTDSEETGGLRNSPVESLMSGTPSLPPSEHSRDFKTVSERASSGRVVPPRKLLLIHAREGLCSQQVVTLHVRPLYLRHCRTEQPMP